MNSRNIRITLIAWFVMIGIDFFIHAGLLANLYMQESPFLLSETDAFRLIPVGYLSFLIMAILLVWLMGRLDISGWRSGLMFGLKLGALTWGSLTIGLFSIATAEPALLLGWFAGQTVEIAVAGGFAGAALAGGSLRSLSIKTLALIIVMFILTIVLQNIG